LGRRAGPCSELPVLVIFHRLQCGIGGVQFWLLIIAAAADDMDDDPAIGWVDLDAIDLDANRPHGLDGAAHITLTKLGRSALENPRHLAHTAYFAGFRFDWI